MKLAKTVVLASLVLAALARAEVSGQAPDFSLPGLDSQVHLADLKGKVVYVDFWASWCSPCRDSFPWMAAMQKKYASQGLVFVGINVDRKQKDAENFLQETPAQFTVAFDSQGKTPRAYEVMGMPSAFLIGRDGQVLHTHIGFNETDVASYEQHIQQALQQ